MPTYLPRMRPSRVLAWMVLPALAILLPVNVSAQGAVGTLTAVAGPPLPAGTPIAVVAEEFTDLDTRLKEVIEKALVARGYTIQPDAPFELTYDTEMSGQTDPEPPGVGEDPVEAVATDMERTPGWNDGGGELGRNQPDMADGNVASIPLGSSATGSDENEYSLSFTLGRGGSPAIWQGTVTAVLPTGDPFEIAETMVPVLTDHIGQTVRGKQIPME